MYEGNSTSVSLLRPQFALWFLFATCNVFVIAAFKLGATSFLYLNKSLKPYQQNRFESIFVCQKAGIKPCKITI